MPPAPGTNTKAVPMESILAGHRTVESALQCQRQSVTDRHERHIDPRVAVYLFVERADGNRIGRTVRRIDDLAIPEHIIDGDQTAATHQLERVLVICIVI